MNLNFTLILQIISFLILLGLLTKFLYKPFMKYLDERALGVKNMIDGAKKAEDQARRYAEETHKALDMAKAESAKMKKEAMGVADEERRRIIEEAKKEARFLAEKAMGRLERDKDELLKKIHKDVAAISVDIAKRVLGREISQKDHERLIEESIKEIGDEISRPAG